ncbi:MAG: DUF4840 domain-containing protein [Bacteroides sp.]|nr:DUF4840 domain-containing protein [Bacteroides sp.]
MILGCSFGFVSCSDDDDNPAEPTTQDAWGAFKGTMLVVPINSGVNRTAEQAGTAIEATVKNDTVYFDDFAIKDLIASLVPEEEQVEAILKAIGPVKYKIGYKAALNAAKDSVYMTYDPKPLEITVPMSEEVTLDVKVDVTALAKGSYKLSSKNFKFGVKAESVTVGGQPFPAFMPSTFNFVMKKDK